MVGVLSYRNGGKAEESNVIKDYAVLSRSITRKAVNGLI